jgi:hypothetical protein
VIVTVAYAPARAIWSSYTTEKRKVVAVVPVAGDAVGVHRWVAFGGLLDEQTGSAAAGRAVPTTVSEAASSSATIARRVARVTFVPEIRRVVGQT